MSRRTHACLTCPGRTRHRAVCGPCRRRGVRFVDGEILLPISIRRPAVFKLLKVPPADVNAPTITELSQSIDLSCFIERVTVR